MRLYSIKICTLTRYLPIIKTGPKSSIALFNLLGDGELVSHISTALINKLNQFQYDILVGPEIKVVPLLSQMTQSLGIGKYVIARDQIMDYMISPEVLAKRKTMVLNGPDVKLLKGKRAIIVTDVVSTGVTVNVLKELLETVYCNPVAVAAVLKQGQLAEKIKLPLIFLGTLPIIRD